MSLLDDTKKIVKKTAKQVAKKVDITKQRVEGEVEKAKAEAKISIAKERNKRS